MDEFSVSFTDPMMVDLNLFKEWLQGRSEMDAAKSLAVTTSNSVGDIPLNILLIEVKEQFVLFKYLKEFLHSPFMLNSPVFSSLPPKTKQNLIENYYEFDKEVLREILGKKMSAKLRKDMDDVSEKTTISLQSCRRQFDNIKNIIKTYEELDGSIQEILTKQFGFSSHLLKMYLPLVFVFIVRFETSKKRLQYLSYDDIIKCSECMMEKWTFLYEPHSSADLCIDIDDIDRNFVQELRDLRNFILEKDIQDIHKITVMNELDKEPTTLHFTKSVDTNFKTLTRNLFVLGAGLSHTKDFRDFFNDCIEKLIEPIKQVEWYIKDLDIFLEAMITSWKDFHIDGFESSVRKFDGVYLRYMRVMKKCLIQMYHS